MSATSNSETFAIGAAMAVGSTGASRFILILQHGQSSCDLDEEGPFDLCSASSWAHLGQAGGAFLTSVAASARGILHQHIGNAMQNAKTALRVRECMLKPLHLTCATIQKMQAHGPGDFGSVHSPKIPEKSGNQSALIRMLRNQVSSPCSVSMILPWPGAKSAFALNLLAAMRVFQSSVVVSASATSIPFSQC